jgi:hypothetical protein
VFQIVLKVGYLRDLWYYNTIRSKLHNFLTPSRVNLVPQLLQYINSVLGVIPFKSFSELQKEQSNVSLHTCGAPSNEVNFSQE